MTTRLSKLLLPELGNPYVPGRCWRAKRVGSVRGGLPLRQEMCQNSGVLYTVSKYAGLSMQCWLCPKCKAFLEKAGYSITRVPAQK